jgi:hemin uptake protein HemP
MQLMKLAPPAVDAPLSKASIGLPPAFLDSRELLPDDRREVLIAHRGQHYRLRITRAGKLLLTK